MVIVVVALVTALVAVAFNGREPDLKLGRRTVMPGTGET
jgi:hypothetical protein